MKAEVSDRTMDLKKSNEKLRNLAWHMDKVREEEKAMLSREIHDELGHTLAALMMGISQLGHLMKKNQTQTTESSRAIQTHLNELGDLVHQASNTSRKIMSDLRPSVLEDIGLIAAIEWLAHEFEAHHGIGCRIQAPDAFLGLPDDTAIALFRIVQESLTNIAKHANAQNIEVSIKSDGQQIILQVMDDGDGLDADWKNKEGSYGLQGMQERVMACGGEFNLRCRPDQKGVSLRVRVPFKS